MQIPKPNNVSTKPDNATQDELNDYTGVSAANRVLRINLPGFKYGTDDKRHAAALVFSFLLLIFIAVLAFIDFGPQRAEWFSKVFTWATNAFFFTIGVAITGVSTKNHSD